MRRDPQLAHLYSLSRRLDDELLQVFAIPRRLLPEIRPSSGEFGRTHHAGVVADGLPIAALIGDSHAALFGQAAFQSGTVKATYGTGSSLMTLTSAPRQSRHGLSTTVAWQLPAKTEYALEGNITMTGGAIDWFGQFIGAANAGTVTELAATVSDAAGVMSFPHSPGLGRRIGRSRARFDLRATRDDCRMSPERPLNRLSGA